MATTVGSHSVVTFTSPVNGDALDATVVRGNDNTLRTAYVAHDADTGIHLQSSTLAARPAAGTAGRKWMTTDTGNVRLWVDNGTAWEEVVYSSTGGSGSFTSLNITGNSTLGDADTDTLAINAEVVTDIIPDVNNTYDLGSAAKKWAEINVVSVLATTVAATGAITGASVDVSGLAESGSLTVTSGTVSVNGVSYAWPSTQGAVGTFLQNNGSGTLTWASTAGLTDQTAAVGASSYEISTADNGERLSFTTPRSINFTTATTNSIPNGTEIAVVNLSDGPLVVNDRWTSSLDTTFADPNVNGLVYSFVEQPDGKLVIAGTFTSVAGTARNNIARLNSDGTLDTGFDPNLNGACFSVVLQSDGKVVIAGGFTTIGGNAQARLGRINADGTWDSSWTTTSASSSMRLLPGPDDRVIYFSGLTLGRYNANGTTDSTFTSQTANTALEDMWLMRDGSIIVYAAALTALGSVSATRIARVNARGVVDPDWLPNPDNVVNGATLLPDNTFIISGAFTNLGGFRSRLTEEGTAMSVQAWFSVTGGRCDVMTDGSFLITTTAGTVYRIKPNELVTDAAWVTNANGQIYMMREGKFTSEHTIYMAGNFTTLGGTSRVRFGRVKVTTDALLAPGVTVIPQYSTATFRKLAAARWVMLGSSGTAVMI